MRVELEGGEVVELGTTETAPTISMIDHSRRVTDDFGVTTVVKRGFARRMAVRLGVPPADADALQLRLASLRATSALWIADDRYASLSVQGFYKDFSLDVALAGLSFCTLTVEGLSESAPAPDTGGDPAPVGRTSTLRLLSPVTITTAMLTATNVAETDYPEWAPGTSYALGARVIKAATHRIYESAIAANLGNDPSANDGKWIDIGPTNRWAMFDEALGTQTSRASPIVMTVAPGAVAALAMLDVVGATVRVQTTGEGGAVYDRTLAVGPGPILFLDLPGAGSPITVTLSGAGTVSVGTFLVGALLPLGITEASPTAGITDFSRKEADDFGEVTIIERAWAKRMTTRALIRSDAIDNVFARIAAVRARPSLWIGEDQLDSLTLYGFFKDFSIEVGETVSTLSLAIEGLSKAADLTLGRKLMRMEKITSLIPLNKRVEGELALLNAQVPSLAGYPIVAAAAAAAADAWAAWVAYRDGLTPAWDDTSADTTIDRATYNDQIQNLLMAVEGLALALRAATEILADSALTSAEAAAGLAGGKSTIFYQPTPPTAAESEMGDLWIDTDNGNVSYKRLPGDGRISIGGTVVTWPGYGAIVYPPWAPVDDQRIAQALVEAAGAQATADSKIITFNQEAMPTAEGVGDLWYQPSTKSLKRWDGDSWEEVATVGATPEQLALIADALTAAANAQATADGKIDSYYQATAPASASEGDLWTDTDDANKLYRYTSGAWVLIRDTGIASAISAAAGAQATADGKVTSFVGTVPPTAEGVGDLWYNPDTGVMKRWDGTVWEDTADTTALNQVTATIVQSIDVPADYLGVITSGTLPKYITPVVKVGGVDARTSNSAGYVLGNWTGGCDNTNTTVDNGAGSPTKGRITIASPWNATGTVDLTVSWNGIAIGTWRITITKKLGNPPSGGGGGGNNKSGSFDPTGLGVASVTLEELGRVINLTKAAGETIRTIFSASYTVSATANASRHIIVKAQYSPAGANSWTDVAAAITGSSAQYLVGSGESTIGTVNWDQSAAPADGAYDVRLVAAINSNANLASLTIETGNFFVEIGA